MKLVAIIFSILITMGTLVPGLQIGWLFSSKEMPVDGLVILLINLLLLVICAYDLIKKQRSLGIFITIVSIICLLIAGISLTNYMMGATFFEEEQDELRFVVGIVTVIAGSLGLLITGFLHVLKKANSQDEVAGFIANRIAFNRSVEGGGKKSFSRFIIRLSTVATVISVAVMIITLAFANGFQETVSQKVFSFWGHLRIQERQPYKALIAEEIPIIQNDTIVQEVKSNPQVEDIHPFATKYGMLKTTDEIEGVLVKGFDSSYNFDHLREFIIEGRPIKFSDSSYNREIILSSYTAKQLGLKLNDRILIYFIRPPDVGGEQKIGYDKLTVVGIYKTGIEEYDRTFAIADIKLIRRLNYWDPDQIGGYEIFLKDYKKVDRVANEIFLQENFPQTWETQSVRNISPNIFDWLKMQDVTRNVLIGFMIVVALINLITCLIILVLERIRMVGILKSLGATDWTVQKIFLHHSLIITITGILIGLGIALGLLYLQEKTGFITLKEEAYYLSKAAVKIAWWQIGLICAGTLIICMLVLMIPSIIVRKIQPVKAIQFR